MDKVSIYFPSEDVKWNMLLSPYLHSWCHYKLYDLSSINLLNQWSTGGKTGEDKNIKVWISWMKRAF